MNKFIKAWVSLSLGMVFLGPIALSILEAKQNSNPILPDNIVLVTITCWTVIALSALGLAAWVKISKGERTEFESRNSHVAITDFSKKVSKALLNRSANIIVQGDTEKIAKAIMNHASTEITHDQPTINEQLGTRPSGQETIESEIPNPSEK